jgi:precorrin-8X/cobalt-precorrin-8 methylmutase
MPVGFVGAAESKQALLESGLVSITMLGRKGGTPAAVATINALMQLAGGR